MDEIIVGFSRPKSWFNPFSWLIRIAEGTPWKWAPMSHAYVKYFDSVTGLWLIFQASGQKVNFISQDMFDVVENIVGEFSIPVTASTKLSTMQKAQKICGSPYGVKEILGFAIVMLVSLLGKKIKNPFASNTSYFCSQLACDIINEIVIDESLDSASCSPLDLYNFLKSNNFTLVGN
jgi:hypothetical protein